MHGRAMCRQRSWGTSTIVWSYKAASWCREVAGDTTTTYMRIYKTTSIQAMPTYITATHHRSSVIIQKLQDFVC